MERSQVLDAVGQPKLYGMRTACDEIIATAVVLGLIHIWRAPPFAAVSA